MTITVSNHRTCVDKSTIGICTAHWNVNDVNKSHFKGKENSFLPYQLNLLMRILKN